MNDIFTTEIVLSIIGVVFTIISALITKKLLPLLVAKFGIVKLQKAMEYVTISVHGIEELYKATTKQGLFKKADALDNLNSLNLGYTDAQLVVFINSTVKKMNEEKERIANAVASL